MSGYIYWDFALLQISVVSIVSFSCVKNLHFCQHLSSYGNDKKVVSEKSGSKIKVLFLCCEILNNNINIKYTNIVLISMRSEALRHKT